MNKIYKIMLVLLVSYSNFVLAQNHLDVSGNAKMNSIQLDIDDDMKYLIYPLSDILVFAATNSSQSLSIHGQGRVYINHLEVISSEQDQNAGNVVWLSDGTLALRQYQIGDTAQGGMVFWVDTSGEHGLVCALKDLESSPSDFSHEWSATNSLTTATNDDIEGGLTNSMMIVTMDLMDDDSAARLCLDYQESEYSDWYLPSLKELTLMHNNLHLAGLGGFQSLFYWSSTELSNIQAAGWSFNMNALGVPKSSEARVRAIRKF